MIPMHDLDETHQTLIGEIQENHPWRLGFDEHTFLDLVGMVYKVFLQGKDEVLLEEQRPRRRAMKN